MKYEKVITLDVTRVSEGNFAEIERIMGVKVVPDYPDFREYDEDKTEEYDGTKFYGIDFEGVDSETYTEGEWIGLWSSGAWFYMDDDYEDGGAVQVQMDNWELVKFPSKDAFWASLRKAG